MGRRSVMVRRTLKKMNLSTESVRMMFIRVALQKICYGGLKDCSEAVRMMRRYATSARLVHIIRQYHLERDRIFCLRTFEWMISWEYSAQLEDVFVRALMDIASSDMGPAVRLEACRVLGLLVDKGCLEQFSRLERIAVDKNGAGCY